MKRRVSVFGATGSVGKNTIDLLRRQGGTDAYEFVAMTGGRNVEDLAALAREFNADLAVTAFPECFQPLKEALAGTRTEVAAGFDAVSVAAERPVDWAMSAIVGAAGLLPTVNLARHAKTLALANKESLVCAGPYLKSVCHATGCTLVPVDSEHSAIFQCLDGRNVRAIAAIVLTASGGPFRTWSSAEIAGATVEQALKHPNWEMGARITVDSASMFNKALEMIEAQHLFDVFPEQIEVVVHPQSIIHSMVRFKDGAIIAQLGPADMRGPIGFALNYPGCRDLPVEALDFAAIGKLEFEAPDPDRFPSLRLARAAMEAGGACGAVFNAAKEAALDAFLAGGLKFPDMAAIVEKVMDEMGQDAVSVSAADGLDPILELDARARTAGAKLAMETYGA